MKRCMMLLVAVVFLFMGSENVWADIPEIPARAAILMDRMTGRVLYEQNADELLPIASITKIMTALLAVENCNMDEMVTASNNASGTSGTSIYLGVGEQLTMREMLLGLMLRSGNDVAVAIAEHIDGSVEAFARRMNARARELGADANFVNPHGLDADGHQASARAMALIAREAMGNEAFRSLVSTQEAVIPWVDNEYNRVLRNKNRLLTSFEGATGIKTGFTQKAGRCLAFSAQADGAEYIGVVLNCGTWFDSAEDLLTWGFDIYQPETAVSSDVLLTEMQVVSGRKRVVGVQAQKTLVVPISEADEWEVVTELPDSVRAPIKKGDPVGTLRVEVDGTILTETPLLANEDIDSWGFGAAFQKISHFWSVGSG